MSGWAWPRAGVSLGPTDAAGAGVDSVVQPYAFDVAPMTTNAAALRRTAPATTATIRERLRSKNERSRSDGRAGRLAAARPGRWRGTAVPGRGDGAGGPFAGGIRPAGTLAHVGSASVVGGCAQAGPRRRTVSVERVPSLTGLVPGRVPSCSSHRGPRRPRRHGSLSQVLVEAPRQAAQEGDREREHEPGQDDAEGAVREREPGERDRRQGQGREADREPAGRLLALDDQGRREDRVGEEGHHDDPDRAHRGGDGLVDDEPERQPDEARGWPAHSPGTAGRRTACGPVGGCLRSPLTPPILHRGPVATQGRDGERAYTRSPVADLPLELPGGLADRLAHALDQEGKIPRALDALGPLGGREVALVDAAGGIRARSLAMLPARLRLVEREPAVAALRAPSPT